MNTTVVRGYAGGHRVASSVLAVIEIVWTGSLEMKWSAYAWGNSNIFSLVGSFHDERSL